MRKCSVVWGGGRSCEHKTREIVSSSRQSNPWLPLDGDQETVWLSWLCCKVRRYVWTVTNLSISGNGTLGRRSVGWKLEFKLRCYKSDKNGVKDKHLTNCDKSYWVWVGVVMMWSVEVVGGGSDVMRSHHQLRPATTPTCGRSGVLEDGTFVNHFLPHIVYGKSHDENFLLLSLTTIKFKHETKRRCLLCCSTHVVVIQSNKYNFTLLQSRA